MTSLVCFWLGVKSRGSHRAETFDMTNSLWRMFSTTPSREMSTALAVIHHHVVNMVDVYLGGGCGITSGLGLSSKLSLTLLNSAAHFCTVDKAGTSSPNVATMSAWMSLGANPLFYRYLIIPRCQILSIFTKCLKCYFSKSWITYPAWVYLEGNNAVSIRKVESNACQFSLLWHNSFLVSLYEPFRLSLSSYNYFVTKITGFLHAMYFAFLFQKGIHVAREKNEGTAFWYEHLLFILVKTYEYRISHSLSVLPNKIVISTKEVQF